MYLTQEIPIIKNKIVYFVGSSDLEISNENEISDLILTLKGFIYSLENQRNIIFQLTGEEIETFYNKIYLATQDFLKIQKRMIYYNYFGNNIIRNYFEEVINLLKQMRKELLKIIEGDLVVAIQTINQNNIINRLNKN